MDQDMVPTQGPNIDQFSEALVRYEEKIRTINGVLTDVYRMSDELFSTETIHIKDAERLESAYKEYNVVHQKLGDWERRMAQYDTTLSAMVQSAKAIPAVSQQILDDPGRPPRELVDQALAIVFKAFDSLEPARVMSDAVKQALLNRELEKVNEEHNRLHDRIKQLKKDLRGSESDKTAKAGQVQVKSEKLEELSLDLEKSEENAGTLARKLTLRESEINDKNRTIERMRLEAEANDQLLAECRKNLTEVRGELENKSQKVKDLGLEVFQLGIEVDQLKGIEQELEKANEKVSRHLDGWDRLHQLLELEDHRFVTILYSVQRMKAECKSLQQRNSELEERCSDRDDDLGRLESQLEKANNLVTKNFDDHQTKLEALNNYHDSCMFDAEQDLDMLKEEARRLQSANTNLSSSLLQKSGLVKECCNTLKGVLTDLTEFEQVTSEVKDTIGLSKADIGALNNAWLASEADILVQFATAELNISSIQKSLTDERSSHAATKEEHSKTVQDLATFTTLAKSILTDYLAGSSCAAPSTSPAWSEAAGVILDTSAKPLAVSAIGKEQVFLVLRIPGDNMRPVLKYAGKLSALANACQIFVFVSAAAYETPALFILIASAIERVVDCDSVAAVTLMAKACDLFTRNLPVASDTAIFLALAFSQLVTRLTARFPAVWSKTRISQSDLINRLNRYIQTSGSFVRELLLVLPRWDQLWKRSLPLIFGDDLVNRQRETGTEEEYLVSKSTSKLVMIADSGGVILQSKLLFNRCADSEDLQQVTYEVSDRDGMGTCSFTFAEGSAESSWWRRCVAPFVDIPSDVELLTESIAKGMDIWGGLI
ncbi:hypothetical protein G7Y89_g1712 [Cudoniella acicularis]|uniref:Uncharacterized protein n=1 Tax=Cudoniella acicularis TaxID=354080 RepID=A0A8H4WA09_9HELO|nr:hypothetical protein G7Y89_g1712 [Cudoniella acicularis]